MGAAKKWYTSPLCPDSQHSNLGPWNGSFLWAFHPAPAQFSKGCISWFSLLDWQWVQVPPPHPQGWYNFEGNQVHIACIINAPHPQQFMEHYVNLCDCLFPLHPQLWLRNNSTVLMRSWFLCHLSSFYPPDITGQSMHAGGMVLRCVQKIHSKECHCASHAHTQVITTLFMWALTCWTFSFLFPFI